MKRRLFLGVIGLLLLLALLVRLTALRLFVSPVSVATFVNQIEDMAASNLPTGQILQLEDAQVSMHENGGLALRLC